MTPKHLICALKTCGNRKANIGDLLCPGHWRQVPRKLKLALWEAENLRSISRKERECFMSADAILTWVEENISLQPPDTLAHHVLELPKLELPDTKRIITSEEKLVAHEGKLVSGR